MKLYDQSFFGYAMAAGSPHRVVFTSLVHFFEAEKFRTVNQDLYLAALNCPTLRELRKFEKRHRDHWREDWMGVRARVMVSALVYAYWASDKTGFWEPTETAQEALSKELQGLGFPPKFSTGVVAELHQYLASPSCTLLGVDHAPPDVIGKRLNTIHRTQSRRWTLNHWLGRHTNWKMNEWAVNQFIPVRYFGTPGQRLLEADIDDMSGPTCRVFVFEQRGGKHMDKTLRQLRAKKAALDIDFYTPPSDTTGTLNGISQN